MTTTEELSFPASFTFEAAEVATAGLRDLETALALATHQCAALAAGVEATVGQAITDLSLAVTNAELRLELVAARVVERIELAARRVSPPVVEGPAA